MKIRLNNNLLYWLSFDFGNSFYTISLGGLFLAQWVVLDKGLEDIWYSATFSLSTVLILITAPIFGAWSDKVGRRYVFLKWLAIATLFVFGLLSFIAPTNLPFKIYVVLGLALIVQYLYQLSLTFYNSLLDQLSNDKTRGKISGLGETFNNLGWILSILFLLPFASGNITLFGEPGRAQVFFPTFIISIFFSIPLILWFKEKGSFSLDPIKNSNLKQIYKFSIQGFKELMGKNKNVGYFLLAFSLISDGILTFNIYYAIVITKLFHANDTQKSLFLIITAIFMLIGSYFIGRLSDTLGAHKTLILSSLATSIVVGIACTTKPLFVIYIVAFISGLGMGGVYSSARALLVKMSPPDRLGEYFGFYSMFQRFASVTGPLLWGITVLVFKNYGDDKYRVAGLMLTVIMFMGAALMLKVKNNVVTDRQLELI